MKIANDRRQLLRADPEEDHTDKDQQQIDSLGPQVPLMEKQGAETERDDHRTTADHRDDGDHRTGIAQGIEIAKIGGGEKDRDQRNGPAPMKRGSAISAGPPDQRHGCGHHPELIEGVPALDEDGIEPPCDEFVVEAACGTQQGCGRDTVDPDIVTEINPLLSARTAQQQQRDQGKRHTDPLVSVEPFTEDEHGADERHHGPRGIDRADDRQRQMLDSEVSERPRRQDDAGFQHHEQMRMQIARRTTQRRIIEPAPSAGRREDRRQEEQRREEGIEQENGQHGVVSQRLLLGDVIKSQQRRRSKSKQQPHVNQLSTIRNAPLFRAAHSGNRKAP